MSNSTLIKKLDELRKLEEQAAELADRIDHIKDIIKRDMLGRGEEELKIGKHTVRYTVITSNRFDTAAFQKEHSALYAEYSKPTTYRRFSVT